MDRLRENFKNNRKCEHPEQEIITEHSKLKNKKSLEKQGQLKRYERGLESDELNQAMVGIETDK